MNTRQLCLLGLCALVPLSHGAAAPPAEAATDAQLSPVTVQAPALAAVRLDVRTACPGIDAELQKTLSSAWGRVHEAGTMRVQFRLEGGQISEVHSSGMSWDYRPYVRKAVARLNCKVAAASIQDYRFLLTIRDPDEAATDPGQFAMLTEE